MMDFELKLEKPKLSRAWISAATMGAAYFIGKLFSKSISVIIFNLTCRRWPDPNDSILRYDQCHSRALRVHWDHGRHSSGLRLHQKLHHSQDEEVWILWGVSDFVHRGPSSRH
jgi:hypothetical protein